MTKANNIIGLGILIGLFISCSSTTKRNTETINLLIENVIKSDPLPSWNEGATKTAITNYVEEITNLNSENFISISDRIVTFDNDGTLWSEQPLYFQFFFAIDRVKAMASAHPEWNYKQPFKAVLENDSKELLKYGEHGILKIVMATHAGNTSEEFEGIVKEWLLSAKHTTINRPYTELVYQPMLELIIYLQENDFKTFIVSGGGTEFMRTWVEKAYGIPRDQVIGSTIKTKYDYNDGNPVISVCKKTSNTLGIS
jgi:phosphoserine phosphatase